MTMFLRIGVVCFVGLLTIGSVQSCEPWEFRCHNSECIRYMGVCDGRSTCSDGSDELDCPTAPMTTTTTALPPHYRPCLDGSFQCTNGRCIYKHWRCDGQDDCGDYSDEKCNEEDDKVGVHEGSGLALNNESIIGITIALCALVMLVGGISAFLVYYRRKFLHQYENSQPRHASDIMEPIPGLPHNFPREALLREPPPRYTSQQELGIAHVNAGYHDDESMRPPPCYSSNPDINIPWTNQLEPPPCYSSRHELSGFETRVSQESLHVIDIIAETQRSLGISEVNGGSSDTTSKSDVSEIAKDSDIDDTHEWQGGRKWNGIPKSLRKQQGVSASDSNLVHKHDGNVKNISERSSIGDLSKVQGGSMTQSKIITISAFVQNATQQPKPFGKWRDRTLTEGSRTQNGTSRNTNSRSNIRAEGTDQSEMSLPETYQLGITQEMVDLTCSPPEQRQSSSSSSTDPPLEESQTNIAESTFCNFAHGNQSNMLKSAKKDIPEQLKHNNETVDITKYATYCRGANEDVIELASSLVEIPNGAELDEMTVRPLQKYISRSLPGLSTENIKIYLETDTTEYRC